MAVLCCFGRFLQRETNIETPLNKHHNTNMVVLARKTLSLPPQRGLALPFMAALCTHPHAAAFLERVEGKKDDPKKDPKGKGKGKKKEHDGGSGAVAEEEF